jgi:hypothetical protein
MRRSSPVPVRSFVVSIIRPYWVKPPWVFFSRNKILEAVQITAPLFFVNDFLAKQTFSINIG